MSRKLNINVGILGHVDSGKTSLGVYRSPPNDHATDSLSLTHVILPPRAAKALSTISSTASFDKSPQSKERGITLDLGFSGFTMRASWQRE